MQFSERMAHIKPSATLTINAKAVILTTGGFGANEEMYCTSRPDLRGTVSETGYRRGLYPLHRRARHPAPAGSHRRLL